MIDGRRRHVPLFFVLILSDCFYSNGIWTVLPDYSCVWENVRYMLSFFFFLEWDSYVLDEAYGSCNSECLQEFLDYVQSFL